MKFPEMPETLKTIITPPRGRKPDFMREARKLFENGQFGAAYHWFRAQIDYGDAFATPAEAARAAEMSARALTLWNEGRDDWRCQFCGAETAKQRWQGDKCPLCGKKYDSILAQDSEE